MLSALLCAGGCGRALDVDAARTFQQAQATFDKAASPDDFLRAAAIYQEILDRRIVSGAVLYNQGNALMQAGQRGRAIAVYRQAKRYRPRDPYLEANLQYALGNQGSATQRRPMIEYLLFWQNWLSYPEKFYALAGTGGATLALALAALFWRRRTLRRLTLAGVALSVLAAASAGYDWYRCDHLAHGVIVQAETVARKGNASSYEPALTGPLAEGTEFQLVERRGDWLLLRLAGDQEGWVPEKAAALY
jgi:tetratricopeptide (TPR) repeat protein